jgi:HK97 family phage portal protein
MHLEKRSNGLYDGMFVPTRTPYFTGAGVIVDTASALGLATAGACVHLVTEAIGMMPLKVHQGEPPEVVEARDSWQWFRLKEEPNDEQSAFDFWQDAAMSVETTGNAFIWKAVARRPVRDDGDIQLFLLDPSNVQVKRDDANRKYYEVWRSGRREQVPASQILQIRGWTATPGADMGVSPITLYRETLGAALAARQFQSSFYTSGGNIPGIISVPDQPPQEALDRFQLELEQRHAGVSRPLVLTRGATWQTTGISMRDAEYVLQQRFNDEQICRMFRINPRMVGLLLETQKAEDEDIDHFLQVDMAPRIRRIEMALGRDRDLFPTDSDLFPRFNIDAVLRPSLRARYGAYKDGLQAGFLLANEAREKEDLPPVQWGDVIQQTPVGGAPNTPPKPAA